MTGLAWWSQVAANNASIDPTVGMAEGMAPSAVNDGVRALMASASKYRDDIAGALVTSGSSAAYTVTSSQQFDSLTRLSGQRRTGSIPMSAQLSRQPARNMCICTAAWTRSLCSAAWYRPVR